MRFRTMICLSIVLALLLAVSGVAVAVADPDSGILNEDYSYWLADGTSITTDAPNPELELQAIIWVQQTVYSHEASETLLFERLGKEYDMDVYLYAYTVTNMAWSGGQETGGITSFGIDWGNATMVEALVVPDTGELGWLARRLQRPADPADGPAWVFQVDPPDDGILIGASVGGFWAIALTGVDRVVNAAAVSGDPNDPLEQRPIVYGKTTGPVPEPAGILALMVGLVGISARLRKR